MLPFWAVALFGFLIVARATRFLNADYLAGPFRDLVERKTGHGKLFYLITCPWCASIWIGAPVAALAVWTLSDYRGWTSVWLFGGLWSGYSWAYGLAAINWDEDE